MTKLNPITSVSQSGFEAPIGATSDNVFLFDSEGEYLGSLSQFYENWIDFKTNNNFTYTGSFNPVSVKQIKTWYRTYE